VADEVSTLTATQFAAHACMYQGVPCLHQRPRPWAHRRFSHIEGTVNARRPRTVGKVKRIGNATSAGQQKSGVRAHERLPLTSAQRRSPAVWRGGQVRCQLWQRQCARSGCGAVWAIRPFGYQRGVE
jgi:hypothetical protein